MKPLTSKQQSILQFVETFLSKTGFPPTLKEIGDEIGVSNISAVRGHLLAIEKKGYIKKSPDRARSIQVINAPSAMSRIKRKMHEIFKTDEGVFYKIVFGLAWTTYRMKPCFAGKARDLFNKILEKEAMERGWKIIDKNIAPEFISIRIEVWPNHSPERVLRRIQTAGMLLKRRHPDLFQDKNIWDKGYVATTDMEIFDEMVTEFLDNMSGIKQ